MKRLMSFVLLVFISSGFMLANSGTPLPAYETEEEKNAPRIKELMDITPTPPDAGKKIYTPAEFAKMEGVILQADTTSQAMITYYTGMISGILDAGAVPYIVATASEQTNIISKILTPAGIDKNSVVFLTIAHNSFWSRDYGPWHIYIDDVRAIVDQHYYDKRPQDDNMPIELGKLWNEPVFSTGFYAEGGNFMTDGLGTCWMSTGLYKKNNLPETNESKAVADKIFKDYFNCSTLATPVSIPGEGTTHIDMYSKILNQDTIIVGYSNSGWGAKAEEIAQLDTAAAFYGSMSKPDGGAYNIVRMPMTFGGSFTRTFFTHTNSLIVNNVVLVPIYGRGTDDEALKIYRELMPQHKVIGIDSNVVIPSGGAIHCTTIQVPVKTFSACGDGVVSSVEECEFNYLNGATCESLGYPSGVLACAEDCKFDVSGCNGEVPDNTVQNDTDIIAGDETAITDSDAAAASDDSQDSAVKNDKEAGDAGDSAVSADEESTEDADVLKKKSIVNSGCGCDIIL